MIRIHNQLNIHIRPRHTDEAPNHKRRDIEGRHERLAGPGADALGVGGFGVVVGGV